MTGIIGMIALVTVLALSMLITRLAAQALELTGLSHQAARFQARSAFTGVGFTTREAESVVDHPARRRIVEILMVLRSAGLVTIVISLILSFGGEVRGPTTLIRLGVVALVAIGLWGLSYVRWLDRLMERAMAWALRHWTDLDVRDYASLLKLHGDFRVMEIKVRPEDWIAGKSLDQCNLPEEGVDVLAIERADGAFVGAPQPGTEVAEGDTLILYGRQDLLKELDARRAGPEGELAHAEAVSEQEQYVSEQEQREAESRRRRGEPGNPPETADSQKRDRAVQTEQDD